VLGVLISAGSTAEPGCTKIDKYTPALMGSRSGVEGVFSFCERGVRVLSCNDSKEEAISHYIKDSTGSVFMIRYADMMEMYHTDGDVPCFV
jgi:hypothetical protein